MPVADDDDVAEFYAARIRELRAAHGMASVMWRRLANLRLVVFVLAGASAWWAVAVKADLRSLPATAVVVTIVLFVYLVVRSSRARAVVARLADLVAINEEGVRRVRRDWAAMEYRPWDGTPSSHPYAADIDVFGPASLAQLFPALSAAPGRPALASWLLSPAAPQRLVQRQLAVAELAGKVAWRDELVLHTRRINTDAKKLHKFRDWIGQDDGAIGDWWLHVTTIVTSVILLVLVIARVAGVTTHPFWLVPLVAGGFLTLRFGRPLKATLGQVQGQSGMVSGYASIAELLGAERFEADALMQIQRELSVDMSAAHELKVLDRLADCAEVRLSPMLHFVVQALLLWDFHVAYRLVRWKRTAGRRFDSWMEALGETESIAALATIAHDNPAWVFPDIEGSDPAVVSATALGHPLLPASSRITNDVTVGPPGTLLFVTGSNMAGKSTLLRTIGLNVVLAQAGSVVCATAMKCTPVSLHTSMRVQDSLEHGVSYFMAELERLKLIVDAAEAASTDSGRTVLYLLDEILHGTNSVERTIAARHVLVRLLALGAVGAVTTHDLQLADAEALAGVAQHVHFQEGFSRTADGHPAMYFDYKLRAGKATSSNALKLLELVGLVADAEHLAE